MKKTLIYINVVIFGLLFLTSLVFKLCQLNGYGEVLSWVACPSDLSALATRPWTVVTYMFADNDLLNTLFNLLCLYWVGEMFYQVYSSRQLVGMYVFGGLCGALLYVVASNLFPYMRDMAGVHCLMGASASMLSLMGALLYKIPNVELRFFIIGRLKFKWVALAFIVIDILFLLEAPGRNFAHIGGFASGLLFAWQFDKGRDITEWINKVIDFLATAFRPVAAFVRSLPSRVKGRKQRIKVHYYDSSKAADYDYNIKRKSQQEEIDRILDKIKQSGYSSLTKEEKQRLFDAGRKD